VAVGTVAIVAVGGSSKSAYGSTPTPIQHVVVFYQENHSFDNLLGGFCKTTAPPRCDGVTTGVTQSGARIPLAPEPDSQPDIGHTVASQTTAVNGGKMDGFDKVSGCTASTRYACYVTETQSGIPNTWALASTFAISDHTFSLSPVPSWAAHEELVTALLDGFQGDIPTGAIFSRGDGWGCGSGGKEEWSPTGKPPWKLEPSCVPAPSGSEAASKEPTNVKKSPVHWIPTIMDSLTNAGETWKIYNSGIYGSGAVQAICPTFADCLYSNERANWVNTKQILTDAAAGTLPNFAILTAGGGVSGPTSQHPPESMIVGDDWIGKVVSAIEDGPDWDSTAILLTYDDCGCFYDHVPPPAGTTLGLRVPMLLISPWVKPGYTDSNVASFASILAFSETVLGLPPLNNVDGSAYNYMDAFDFSQSLASVNRHRVRMVMRPEPASSRADIRAHPPSNDDPT